MRFGVAHLGVLSLLPNVQLLSGHFVCGDPRSGACIVVRVVAAIVVHHLLRPSATVSRLYNTLMLTMYTLLEDVDSSLDLSHSTWRQRTTVLLGPHLLELLRV